MTAFPYLIQCPDCRGSGAVTGFACGFNDAGDIDGGVHTMPCFRCKGERGIPAEWEDWIRQGEAIRTDRIRERCSGRERARMLGITPRQLNDVEHGKVDPAAVLPR